MKNYETPQIEVIRFETEAIMNGSVVGPTTPIPDGNETPVKPFADITD